MKIVFSIICIFFYPFSVIHHGLGTTCGILKGGAGEEKERFPGQKLKIPDNSRENQVRINSDWNSVRESNLIFQGSDNFPGMRDH